MITTSIVIPTCRRPELLARTLKSIAEAHWPQSFEEVIVVENDGLKHSAAVCARYTNLPIRYLTESVSGAAHTRNRGWQAASSDIILFFDDDIRINADTMTAYEQAFQEFGTNYFYGGPVEPDYAGKPPPQWLLRHLPFSTRGLLFKETEYELEEPNFLGANHAVPRRLLESLGGYRGLSATGPNGGGVGEETRLQTELMAAGIKGRIVARATVHHNVPESNCTPDWVVHRRWRHGLTDGWQAASVDGQRTEPWMWRLLLRHKATVLWRRIRRGRRESRFGSELKAAWMAGYITGLREGRP